MKNKKKILLAAFIFCCFIYMTFCLSGCGSTPNENEIETHNMIGTNALIELPVGEGLYYDYTTGIVYWWNGVLDNVHVANNTTPTPYYSPNGLLYRYIPETNSLEEINNEKEI